MTTQKTDEISFTHLVARKFVSGSGGGVVQAICSHPMDLVKSRVQSGTYPSLLSCIQGTLTHEGPLAFYKGIAPPIAISGLYNAVLFASNEGAKKVIISSNSDLDPQKPLPLRYICLAGMMAAPPSCLVITPADIIKIQLQIQKEAKAKAQYSGMFDCAFQLWKEEGIKALFRGYVPTLATRVVGLPGFFAANQVGREWYSDQFPDHSNTVKALFGGGCAGLGYWFACYPLDLIKVRTQSQKILPGHPRLTPMQIAKSIYVKNGLVGFSHGFAAAMFRSLPATSSVFVGIDWSEHEMKKLGI